MSERIKELKVAVYDILAQKQYLDMQLQKANEEIYKLSQEEEKAKTATLSD